MIKLKRTRLSPNHRYVQILNATIELAEEGYLYNVKASTIAKKLHISKSLVYNYFNSMRQLQDKVIERAITKENHIIIRQAVISHDPAIENCPPSLKTAAFESTSK